LYDINPSSNLNNLRFCRKNDIQSLIQPSACNYKPCVSNCLNITLPSQSDDARFGFYACLPKNSLAGIVYTQAFPEYGDFIRPSLPMDYSVALRRNYNDTLIFSFQQTDQNLRYPCYEYLDFDRTGTLNDALQLTCDASNTNNKTMSGIIFKKDFDGLVSLSLQDRRMSGHHTRFIDYELCKFSLSITFLFFILIIDDSRCRYQGIYHPYINQCICAPGFYGDECQYSKWRIFMRINEKYFLLKGCPPGYYGQTCDYHCAGDDDYCKGLLICLPDPYGCSCYTGWYGTTCNISKDII
jgi:hypothetical protein